jgi:probable rRNA maturation factor
LNARSASVRARRPAARNPRRPGRALQVDVQVATARNGVPHTRTLSRWANAAVGWTHAARRAPRADSLAIRVVGAAESRRLNRTWRGKDKPTNVLSFPAAPLPSAARDPVERPGASDLSLGDLAICAPVVAREAREQGKSAREHWAHMVIHGVLHLLGYDHENDRDAVQMESIEIRILEQLGYSNPYA